MVNKTKSIKQVRAIRCSQRNDGCRAALRPPIPNRRRSALGGAEKFLLPSREQDVAQRGAVVHSVDGQAKAVEHRGLRVRKLDSDVFELIGSRAD